MTVSGTISSTVFNTNRVIDTAYRRCKIPAQRITPEMQEVALNCLYLLFSSMPSRGTQLWATDSQILPLVQGEADIELPAGTIDLLSANVSIDGNEIPLARISQDTYDATPNKATQGRPLQFWLDRQRDVPIMRIWQTPDADHAENATIVVRRTRHIMDVGTLTGTLDVPQRWHNAITAELAFRVAMETPEVDPSLTQILKMLADEAFSHAQREERDASPIVFMPRIGGYTR